MHVGDGISRVVRVALRYVGIAFAFVILGSCSGGPLEQRTDQSPNAYDTIQSADLRPRNAQPVRGGDISSPQAQPRSFFGSFGSPAPTPSPGAAPEEYRADATDAKDGFTLNFENSPVASVAKVILGDILGVGYFIDPRAQGTITLSSGRPIAKKDMLFVLENALQANNLAMMRESTGYRIGIANNGSVGAVDRVDGGNGAEPGYGVSVIPLHYISGSTLSRLLDGFAARPGAIWTDTNGNVLIVIGSGPERQTAIDTVRSFDVDWMRGQSVGIYPVANSAPEPLVAELEKIMDVGENGRGQNPVKFQPISRQNAILVVASRPQLLNAAATWIARLDLPSNGGTTIKVYRVKYGDAKQISELLSKIFGGELSSDLDSTSNQIAPGAGTTTLSAADRLTAGPRPDSTTGSGRTLLASAAQGADATNVGGALTGKSLGAGALPGVRITPDVANNSVLIYASEENYRIIERALNQLDRPKLQVAIDVTIAEVTLNDDLSYGVQFFIHNKYGSLSNSTQTVANQVLGAPPR